MTAALARKRHFVVSAPLGVKLVPPEPDEGAKRQRLLLAAQRESAEVARIAALVFGIQPDDPAYQPVRQPITAVDVRHALRLAFRAAETR